MPKVRLTTARRKTMAAARGWGDGTAVGGVCGALACLLLATRLAGCTRSSPPPPARATRPQQTSPQTGAQTPDPRTRGSTSHKPRARLSQARTAVSAAELLAQAEQELKQGDLEQAQALLVRAEERPDYSRVQATARELEARVAAAQAERLRARRAAALSRAGELLAAGDLENALASLEEVKSLEPSVEERAQADKLISEIERRRRVRRKLLVAMQLLGSAQRAEVRAAQSELFAEPDVALPLLLQAVQADQPTLVANALEMLRRLNRPAVALPAMVEVLKRPAQQASWPAAVRELTRAQAAGAGPALLELAVRSELPEQRAAALQALAEVPDPPQHTLPALMPLIEADDRATPAALQAAAHAVLVHQQQDLAARRGLDGLDAASDERLTHLETRLAALTARWEQEPELAAAAARLALCTRLVAPQPLEGVRLASFSGELPASPATAVVDGVWSAVGPETQWRLPASQRAALVLDLGRARLVCGVKVWNLNEPGSTHRGWKEVELFVSDSPAPLAPLAEGLVLPAPGAADAADYGTYLPVPPTLGRYVKLQARSAWREDVYKGLSEVQVWGLGP
ncbi:MAG: hypothetical protein K6T86_04455 [Pirellulales bacterium]|nr:hypothetical protein [Pirellulales bacterium]